MPKPRVTARQRAVVIARACACCKYGRAQELYAPDPFSVEHIIPVVRGGTNALANLAFSCQGCNGRKYVSIDGIDPATGMITPLYHPRQHQWQEHFSWNPDYSLIIGLTPTGHSAGLLPIGRLGGRSPPKSDFCSCFLPAKLAKSSYKSIFSGACGPRNPRWRVSQQYHWSGDSGRTSAQSCWACEFASRVIPF